MECSTGSKGGGERKERPISALDSSDAPASTSASLSFPLSLFLFCRNLYAGAGWAQGEQGVTTCAEVRVQLVHLRKNINCRHGSVVKSNCCKKVGS